MSPLFVELLVLALAVLWIACAVEQTRIGGLMGKALDCLFVGLRAQSDLLIRAGVAAFCLAVAASGGVILTPELKTAWPEIAWLQAGIAICTLWQSTRILSGIGLVVLYALGVGAYGAFHMMDYPIFLGAAGYLIVTGLRQERLFGLRPLALIRWGAAITLMWASVEKWAYPGWSYPLLTAHPDITVGLNPRFYMVSAGIVEFSLSFALLWTPLVRRVSAIVLLSMFVGAVFEFGKIDAIGHLLIIVLLLVVAADDEPTHRCAPSLAPAWYSAALAVTVAAYYLGHALLFRTAIV